MAVYFYTAEPKVLLANFKKKIEEGHVVTWRTDEEGDFTHTADQWSTKHGSDLPLALIALSFTYLKIKKKY